MRRLVSLVATLAVLAAAIVGGYYVAEAVKVDKKLDTSKTKSERTNRKAPANPGRAAPRLGGGSSSIRGLTVRASDVVVRPTGVSLRLDVTNGTRAPVVLDPLTWKLVDGRGERHASFPGSGTGAFRPTGAPVAPIGAGSSAAGTVRFRPVTGPDGLRLTGLANDPATTYPFTVGLG